jgi:hypothetical protein
MSETKKKVSRLKAIDPKETEPSKPKILIYGEGGVGKTWTALEFPNVYYFDTEKGADREHYTDKLKASGGKYLGPEHGTLDFDFLIEQTEALATEEHAFKTAVFDSITKAYNTAISNEAERLGDKNAFGADKKPAIADMRRLLNQISRLDMNVIFICHEKDEWGTDAKGDRVNVGKTFDCWDKLRYELDLVLQIQKRGDKRVAIVRKSRLLGFPDGTTFPWSYAEFAERYGKDIIEKAVKQIVLATPEEVAEIKRLTDLFKTTPEEISKWFDKAQVTKWEEMETSTINKCINHLKEKNK